MISVAEALDRIRSGFSLLPVEQVALENALGRVLGEDLASRLSHPPLAVSAMDGYAVRGRDVEQVPCSLKLIGKSQAGSGFDGALQAGQAVRIFTGAPLPEGADTIVMQEITESDGDTVRVLEAVATGRFVRPRGMDFREGDVLLKAGKRLTARDLGLAAAMNHPWLGVRRRPRVAIVATGDEIVMPGEPMSAEQIASSNSVAVSGYVRAFGGEPLNLGVARDTPEHLEQVLQGARGCDLLITIGGASVGDYDLIGQIAGDHDLGFYKIAMRPGKPLIFGRVSGVPLLGLPGNPVSAGVTSFLFLHQAMAAMLGTPDAERPLQTAITASDLGENDERQDYLRATLETDADGNLVATPFQGQDSAMLARFAHADCLIVRPPHAPAVKVGGTIDVLVFPAGHIAF